ncbi:peptide chain release factor N(5)-glutamine methyltransferase [Rhodobacteraceae bacterium 2CG4]|uniref:Release factor glutamine methyltransferase n=1 Tax=Halovulum marinum TaxID=2662447 RepID=A0A6L5Z017_9RHOB|nr:peptide chain release factor N(5)-glutamine methyltransferase [Halovulum marinum]MSU89883.1 peptide chain release factor N(5)-glutamine methyltransferase [Halovulum marinum]
MSETLAQALARAAARLNAAGVRDAARDARALLAHAAGLPPDRVLLERDAPLGAQAAAVLERALADRGRFRPVAQIIGRRCFWGRDFIVTGDVLDPRPETETIVDLALRGPAPARILDLGTGTGVLALTLLAECPQARAVAVDISPAALAVAARNAEALDVADRVRFVQGDWCAGIEGRFDLIVSNPPYIPQPEAERLDPDVRLWEPDGALLAGPDGLDAYRAIAQDLAARMSPGGRALFEHGRDQGAAVAAIIAAGHEFVIAHHDDMSGKQRVVEVLYPR